MADFKQTPASRVFGMGLPRRSSLPPATFFETPIYEERRNLNPMVRQNAVSEQETLMQEQALADQQAQMDRQRRGIAETDAAIADLEAGADIGNVFKQRPGIVFSPNFSQFAKMAQVVQPSKATSTLAPSLAKSLAPQSREKFFSLIQTPQFANDPLGAMTQVQLDEEREKQHGELVKAGIPLAKIDRSKTYSPIEFQELILNAGAKGKDPAMEAMEKQMGMLRDELKFMADSGDFEIPNPAASASDPSIPKFIPRPEYAARQKKLMELSDRYQSYLEGIHSPQQAAAAAATASPPPQAEPQVGLRERMKGLAGDLAGGQPKEQIIAPVKDEEILAALNSPSVDENALIAATTSPSTSLEVKKQALEKLRQFAKNPPKDASLTLAEAKKRAARLRSLVENGEKLIRMQPEIKKINEAWTQEKEKVAKWINDYADSLGVYPEAIENSIRKGEFVEPDSAFNQQEQAQTVRDDLARFIRFKEGLEKDPLKLKATKLEPFHKSEFAKEFGVKNDFFTNYTPTGILGRAITALGFLPSGEKTYGDVLDAYLAEKVPTSATSPQNQVAQPAPTLNVKNVRVKPPEQP